MPKTTYIPFTYVIRLVLARHLVLSEPDMQETAIPMISGLPISLLQIMLLFKDGSMANPMLSRLDKPLTIH